uniref:Uncharacterized protein n=1 Tax=Laticauda laticaudata TaxID=8630 RepID=A0A8C5SP45_LATLA
GVAPSIPDVEHHRSHEVQVREIDAELPSQVEEDEEGPRQPFAKDAVGAGGGRLGKPGANQVNSAGR